MGLFDERSATPFAHRYVALALALAPYDPDVDSWPFSTPRLPTLGRITHTVPHLHTDCCGVILADTGGRRTMNDLLMARLYCSANGRRVMERHKVYHTLKTCTANADLPLRELTCLPRADRDPWTWKICGNASGCASLGGRVQGKLTSGNSPVTNALSCEIASLKK